MLSLAHHRWLCSLTDFILKTYIVSYTTPKLLQKILESSKQSATPVDRLWKDVQRLPFEICVSTAKMPIFLIFSTYRMGRLYAAIYIVQLEGSHFESELYVGHWPYNIYDFTIIPTLLP